MIGPAAAEVSSLPSLLIGAFGATIAALGLWFIQHNRQRDRHDEAVLDNSSATASVTVAAIAAWRDIVAAQVKELARLGEEVDVLRTRAEDCEATSRSQQLQIDEQQRQINRLVGERT